MNRSFFFVFRDFEVQCARLAQGIKQETDQVTGKRDLARLSSWFESFSQQAGGWLEGLPCSFQADDFQSLGCNLYSELVPWHFEAFYNPPPPPSTLPAPPFPPLLPTPHIHSLSLSLPLALLQHVMLHAF